MAIIERYWKWGSLKGHPMIKAVYEQIRTDILEGAVFPAVRENEIHLYHGGGRAFRVKPKSVKTHHRYNGEDSDGEVSLPKLTLKRYERVKEGCKGHNEKPKSNNEWKERWIVSRLFRRFSFWSTHAEPDQPKLVDIEVRFPREKPVPQIDLLFLDDRGQLRFVEVKRQYDGRIRSKDEEPEVVHQIQRYQKLLKRGQKDIRSAYREVPKLLCEALELAPFSAPEKVCSSVPVLVCRKDNRQGNDEWLWPRLQSCVEDNQIGSDLIVDGGSIDADAYQGTEPPAWCPNGLWKKLNLREVFGNIDNLGG